MMPFTHSISPANNGSPASFYKTREIRLYLHKIHRIVTINGVYLTIVIEQYGQIIGLTTYLLMFPRAKGISGNKDLQTVIVDIRKNVEMSVVITQTRCPNALPIFFHSIFETKFRTKFETFKHISKKVPINKIA